jgi:hypothetical protein
MTSAQRQTTSAWGNVTSGSAVGGAALTAALIFLVRRHDLPDQIASQKPQVPDIPDATHR